MSGFYNPNSPYGKNAYIDNLGPYGLNPGLDQLLDTARQIQESENYYWFGVPFPGASDAQIPALGTFSGTLTVPSLAYVLALTAASIVVSDGSVSPPGFKLRIFDKGGKIDTFINAQYANDRQFIMSMNPGSSATGANFQTPTGPLFLSSPMVILEPGALQVEVTNLNNVPVWCQVLFSLCVPVNRQSTNEMMVGRHNPTLAKETN